jgi:hypothetical protein
MWRLEGPLPRYFADTGFACFRPLESAASRCVIQM